MPSAIDLMDSAGVASGPQLRRSAIVDPAVAAIVFISIGGVRRGFSKALIWPV